ncbi:MAG: HIT domain-containing protein [Comamonadaceae bacterium]|nr:HIT domain-containing protein [Comamonadaceae bacterium]
MIIPKRHIATLDDLSYDDLAIGGELLLATSQVAAQEGLTEEGYRMVINCRANGGQEVYHLHVHLLGGRRMSWPPG